MSGWARKTTANVFDATGGVPLGYESDAAKVWIAGGTAGATIAVAVGGTCSAVSYVLSTASAGSASTVVRSALGSGTSTQVRGFSIFNKTTNSRIDFRLSVGTKLVASGGLVAQGAFNWNKIGAYQQKINSSIILWINGLDSAASVRGSVDYKGV